MAQEDVFKKLVSHCKEYGFVFPSSEIYDGLGAVYDYGQMGVELKNNIKQYWWQSMVLLHENIVGIDSAIFMHPTIWKASGHVDAFNDPLIDNRDSKKRYRADVLIEDQIAKYDEKINKEVAKAAKKFGDAFDEAQFRSTNARVLTAESKPKEISVPHTSLSIVLGTVTTFTPVAANLAAVFCVPFPPIHTTQSSLRSRIVFNIMAGLSSETGTFALFLKGFSRDVPNMVPPMLSSPVREFSSNGIISLSSKPRNPLRIP